MMQTSNLIIFVDAIAKNIGSKGQRNNHTSFRAVLLFFRVLGIPESAPDMLLKLASLWSIANGAAMVAELSTSS